MQCDVDQSDNVDARAGERRARLVVFSDDWGRHPSSCQHLIGHLLYRYPTLWVNTIGTRAPGLSWGDAGKMVVKFRQWMGRSSRRNALPANLTVISPPMYPGFRKPWQRRLNARLITAKINRALGPRTKTGRRIAVTTIPVTADLVKTLDVDRWVYYCVDDFSVWPGLDGQVLGQLDQLQVDRVDLVICVSQTLQKRTSEMGSPSKLLTHGIDLSHWRRAEMNDQTHDLPQWWGPLTPPIFLFWGVVDRRLDYEFCAALAKRCGTLALVGPQQSPDQRLGSLGCVCMPGPVPYMDLPKLAAAADVLVMPYADLPVTRSIQPLKFKEYLATGKPVVVRHLPATAAWQDAADVVETVEQFVEAAALRAAHGTPDSQRRARTRLSEESWDRKAHEFEQMVLGQ